MSKYDVFSGLNTRKYGPEKTPYLVPFFAVTLIKLHFDYGSLLRLRLPRRSHRGVGYLEKMNWLQISERVESCVTNTIFKC